jgi:hypothetical protein
MHFHLSPRARKRAAKWRLAQLIKLHSGCVDCGYNEHAVALQFDHIGDDKKMNVSDMIRSDYSWITIMQEIGKCEVRCANCHSVMTRDRKLQATRQYREGYLQDRQSSDVENDSPATEEDFADEVWTILLASSGSLE